jgi:hypothetical protein
MWYWRRLSQIAAVRIFKAWLHPDWVFNLTSLGRDQASLLRHTNYMTSTVSVTCALVPVLIQFNHFIYHQSVL